MEKVIDLEQYLGIHGCRSPMSNYMLDKMRHPHGLTLRQRKRLEKEAAEAIVKYNSKRDALIAEYNEKLSRGEIRLRTKMERMIEKANGHPDNPSTLAARSICEKQGINWLT